MKKIVHTLLLALLLAVPAIAMAQVGIPGTNITFKLNSEDWRYLRTFKLDDGADIYLYCYVGHDVIDTEGDTVLPFLRIYVNSHYSGDLYELIYDRYMQQPYQSLDEYTKGPGLPASGGLGYKGAYTNPSNQKDNVFLMTYFKERRTAVEFRLETTRETYEDMEVKFKKILSSIQ